VDFEYLAGAILLAGLLPAWLAFGMADWICHRQSLIEQTSGWKESAWHLLLVAEAGVVIVPALFLHINALILAIALLAYLAHEITTNLDIAFAAPRRLITATEQRIHDFLSAMPFAALLMLIVSHGAQFAALFGMGSEPADFSIRWKDDPLPIWYLTTWLILSPINGLLYLEEFLRCLKARKAQMAASPQSPKFYGF